MNWEVRISGNAAKRIGKLPYMIQERFKALAPELKAAGPVRDKWAENYGKIQGERKIAITVISEWESRHKWRFGKKSAKISRR